MKYFRKQKYKKYIAGILTIALAAGVCQSYGSMEAMAKEATLPGIEKLVEDTINSGEVFHILEIVPEKKDASIGYLIGGEEPVTEGRKLSELVSETERQNAMQQLKEAIDNGALSDLSGKDGAFIFSSYEEREDGTRSEEIRGHFVFRGEGGRYYYVSEDAQYVMLADGEDYQGERYDRYSSFAEIEDTTSVKKYVVPTFSMISGSTSNQLNTTITEEDTSMSAYAVGKYALSYYDKVPKGRMDSIDTVDFQAADYDNMELWQRQGSSENYYYTYLGRIVFGAALPEDCIIDGDEQPTVSDGNAGIAEQSISGNDAIAVFAEEDGTLPVEPADRGENLYVLDKNTNMATLWAEKIGETYSFTPVADAYFLQFVLNDAGEYYVSQAVVGQDGDWSLTDNYSVSDTGQYKKIQDGAVKVLIAGEEGFDSTQTYDFIENVKEDCIQTVRYNGGFENQEWFRKNVLNLSEEDAARFQISVTTLTPQEVAELVMDQADYGLDLEDVDMIYLSGQGDYTGAEPDASASVAEENAAWQMADAIARMAFGIQSDTDTAQNRNNAVRIPVVMDYNFYAKNRDAQNGSLFRLAQTLLLVSDASVYNALVSEGLNYWNSAQSSISQTDCQDKVNAMIREYAKNQGVENADGLTVAKDGQREFLTDNVYLNDDESRAYAASDFLTDISAEESRAWVYADVISEIRYENFLIGHDDTTADTLAETVSKASATRYILNWYLQRSRVKEKLSILDLEPCYDFGTDALSADTIKAFMGQTSYSGNISITQMASAEFIGKIEDLNDRYDMIYIGTRTGMMNTVDGVTRYNDSSMNGMIYTHVGDVYDYSRESQDNKNRLRDDSINSNNQYRGPGNDMNSTREKEFEQYISAGYPVVLSDQLLALTTETVAVNTTTVDRSSYFYQLLQFALSQNEDGSYKYWQKNVFAESQLTEQQQESDTAKTAREDRQRSFANLLNLSKLQMEWVKDLGEEYMPTELHYNDNGLNDAFLQPRDGKYYLQYIFALSNDAAVSQVSTSYDCKLFVDKNSDGRFSGSDVVGQSVRTTEELAGLSIYVRSGQEWQEVSRVNYGDGEHYELRTGYTYKIIRTLPDDYQGVLPWKLIFYSNADTLVRTAVSGYTAIDRGNRSEHPISVLQLMSDKGESGGKTNWNLQQDTDITSLLNGVREFDVSVESVQTSRFISGLVSNSALRKMNDAQKSEAYYNAAYSKLQQYDMLILGFGDNYRFGTKGNDLANMAVSEAVRDYIESGKSVLFTHDSSSYINSTAGKDSGWYWGYEFNKTIRAEVGLDRYGALREYYEDMKDNSSLTQAQRKRYEDYYNVLNTQYNYDTAWQPGTDRSENKTLVQIEGITKFTVVRYMTNRLKGILNKGTSYTDYWFPVKNSIFYQGMDKNSGSDGHLSDYAYLAGSRSGGPDMKVTQVNEGQVTNYPYMITSEEQDTIAVAATHYQWLQPNMELDKDGDGKNDIVVWYCLSDMSDEAKALKAGKENGWGIDSSLNLYNICPKDVVNNYYIYTMGNVTYSGAGHTKPTEMAEKKLFVNTMIAAYTAGTKAPTMSFLNDNGTSIDSVYMMYDRANKIVLQQDSDVEVSFKANDYNILSSVPEIRVEFYKACEDGEEGARDVAGIVGKVKPISGIRVTSASDGTVLQEKTADNIQYYTVTSDGLYHLTLPLSEMGLFSITGSGQKKQYTLSGGETNEVEPAGIYARVTTYYDNGNKKTDSTVVRLDVSVADLFDLN